MPVREKQWFKQSELAYECGMTPRFFGKYLIKLCLKDLFTMRPTEQAVKSGLAYVFVKAIGQGIICRIAWAKKVLDMVNQIRQEKSN